MIAVFALNPGKTVEQIAATQKPFHNLFDMGAGKPKDSVFRSSTVSSYGGLRSGLLVITAGFLH